MIVNLTGRHVEITEALKTHVEEKLQRALKDFPRIESVRVILTLEKHRHLAEIVVQAPYHLHAEAREETHDMYLSIDAAIEKVLTQLRRRAEKGQAHKAVGLGRTESIVAKDETQPEL